MSPRRLVVLGVVTCLVLAGGLAAWSATGASAAASYRTATATRGSVEQTLTATGTVTPHSQADLSFGTSGKVQSVAVALGDHVEIGDTLAVLDRTALRAGVTSAQADLARAKATLASDQAAQADAVSAASTGRTSPSGSGSSTPPSSSGGGAGSGGSTGSTGSGSRSQATAATLDRLAKEQAALIAAQHEADTALQVSAAASSQQSTACAGVITSDPASTQPPDVTGCQQALGAVEAAQTAVSKTQRTVQEAIEKLSASLTAALKTVSPSTPAASGSTGTTIPRATASSMPTPTSTPTRQTFATTAAAPTASTPAAAGTSGGGPQGSTSAVVTAATLARDQAAIDTARAALVRAKAARDKAHLRTPIAGTVAAVDIAPGDTASTSTVAFVVNGDDGNVEITIDVSENDIGAITVGQDARVSADGSPSELPARVTSVGLLAATDSGTATYPVAVSLVGAPLSLASGSDATVSVVTATVDDVVTVPSSAVTRTATGTSGVVRTLVGDQLTTTRVEIGAVGPVRTEIRSGLKAGQRVVLADLSAALPSSSTAARGGGIGGGGFGGGPQRSAAGVARPTS